MKKQYRRRQMKSRTTFFALSVILANEHGTGDAFSIETRRSELIPWSKEDKENVLGWTEEVRDYDEGSYKAFDGKRILELGSGLGLTGLAAAFHASSCHVTDNDEMIIKALQEIVDRNERIKGKLSFEKLEWRDDHSATEQGVFDAIIGADIAYYHFLLRPLMDTTKTFLDENGDSLWLNVGQANREAQWELYHNLVDGCYNQLTDEREEPWPGTTIMLLYKLRMFKWRQKDEEASMDGTIPVAAMVYQSPGSVTLPPVSEFDHTASKADEESMMMSF